MTLNWMIYTLAVTVLIGAAATATERALRLWKLPTRWIWMAGSFVAAMKRCHCVQKPSRLWPGRSSAYTLRSRPSSGKKALKIRFEPPA